MCTSPPLPSPRELGALPARRVHPNNSAWLGCLGTLLPKATGRHRLALLKEVARLPPTEPVFELLARQVPKVHVYRQGDLVLSYLEKRAKHPAGTLTAVAGLLGHENFFVARRAYQFLKGKPLADSEGRSLERFEETTRQSGRLLD